ncbi:heparan-alpha-glucosaminide N-acetyltransferase domain-containing protein [Corynebacterium bovis]|uniref:heparan-alpha-glucosaminide N-acetyltransferase domain-containing protein n=1 Tax=Corynebacterium bovis TaxID=36808 RepID=UPI000F64A04B|nr:heparan-alpha-glucosaminide N-acetyltransferase domain-containing protein [Corynebacterium bovis]RRO80137.1 hypothetical protein CXF38_07400 [Corynebacterium bovis]RRO80583.1 hypothetical protein CXF36_08380 [Corynebacterium bovis]RRO83169.1 hypothetical protein CXF37_05640 [Corynebacterium bovis]
MRKPIISGAAGRFDGIDIARALAITGMFIMHTFFHTYPEVEWFTVFDGRASALFSVLAGVSVIFLTRHRGGATAVVQLVTRGVLLLALGVALSQPAVGPIVILATYGALYIVVAPLTFRLSGPVLAVAAAVTAVVMPVASWLIRHHLPPAPEFGYTPSWEMVRDGDWVTFLRCLLIDGLFPVMTWIPFFLAGMAVGRLLVATARVHRTARAAGGLVVLGVVLSAATLLVSRFIVGPLGFRDHHAATAPGGAETTDALLSGAFGTVPLDSRGWLAVYVPHSGSVAELVGSTGTAVAVIGACLLVGALPVRPLQGVLYPVRSLGRIPLTAYTAHIVAIGVLNAHDHDLSEPVYSWLNLLLPLAVASVWFLFFRRGPLEAVVSGVSRAAAAPVRAVASPA